MLKAVSVLLLLCSVSQTALSAVAAGFVSGSEFSATPIEGTVFMTCEGFNGNAQVTYSCRDVVLDPQATDIFFGPQDIHATQVELTAVHEDGSDRVKMAGYNGKVGRSTSTFNLWISTLFQKPLLMAGVNKISYSITGPENTSSDGTEIQREYVRGSFQINVKRSIARRCPTTQYHSSDVTDCNSQYSICQRYFEQYNNCR